MSIVSAVRRNLWKLGGVSFALLFCSSCVTMEQDILVLNDQVVALNKRISRLEESIDTRLSGEVDARLQSVLENQAEAGQQVEKVRGQMEVLSSRMKENNLLVQRAVERDTTEQDLVKANVAELTGKVAELEAQVTRLQEYLHLEASGEQKKGVIKKEMPVVRAEKPVPPVPVKEPISPENQLYEETLAAYKEGKHEAALAGFKRFLEKYPQSDLADNAQFWVGETYMALKQYEQAILSYQKVIKNYPKGNKVANAMLRQALAFYEINDKTSARLLLKKIIKNYPKSSEAKIAKEKLKTLK